MITEFNFEDIFGRDAGEIEKIENLKSYFIKFNGFDKFNNKNNNFLIAKGRKGMGKSALLKITEDHAKSDKNNIVISIKGNELLGLSEIRDKSHIYLENHWRQVVCKRICMEIGKRINFAINDDQIFLVENAELENFKERNIFSSLLERCSGIISGILNATSGSDQINLSRDKQSIENHIEILRREQSSNSKTVWLIIDDIDAKYQDTQEYQDRVGAFFTSISSLVNSVNGLIVRTSVRSDVWSNLRSMEDQDKLREFLIDIRFTPEQLEEIVSKRIESYFTRNRISASRKPIRSMNKNEIAGIVFQNPMPWDGTTEYPLLILRTLAGHRPRWIGQLCKKAGETSNGKKITFRNIIDAMDDFGRDKISDINKEHRHQFEEIEKLIESFRSGKSEYNKYTLSEHLKEKFTKRIDKVPDINGYPFKDEFQLAKFLFEIDFFSAKRQGTKKFYRYEEVPTLFDSEENSQNKIQWVVNTSFRNHLFIY